VHVPARRGHHVLHDREPEASAPRGSRSVTPVEALEEPLERLGVDARTVVGAAEDDEIAGASHREAEPRPVTCVADRVLREVLAEDPEEAWPQRDRRVLVSFGLQPHAGAGRAVLEAGNDLPEHRQRVRVTETDDLLAALDLREEEDLVDQVAGVLDLGARLVDQGVDVGAREVGGVEEDENPGERCAQLVRDGRREACAQLVEAAVIGVVCIRHQIVTGPKPGEGRAPVYRRDVAKVLIVEDDNVIADGMARHLDAAGFDPIVVGRGELGLTRLRFENPDVCVLDLMLPELDGWKLIETARAEGIGTPIVVVSARGTEHDRIHALEIGADDYLVKPFSMRELVARVGAAARRGVRPAEEKRGDAIEIEELRIDPREVQAFVDGKSASLTPTEFKLLYTLALDRGRVVTRDELLQKVWGRRETHRDRTVDVFVRRLRQKIDRQSTTHSFIQTRFGVGYKLEPEPK
jgi:two-component system alkaline phosphatase synthesis response regulator PhoP